MIETTQISTEAGMIDLGIGQPQLDLLPHQLLRDAAERVLNGRDNSCLNYGPALGNGYFRLSLAEFLSRGYGYPVDAANLMATGGASQALAMIAGCFAKPGDTVLVEEPTYFLAHQIFADCGLQVVGVAIGPDGLEPDVLQSAIDKHQPALLYTIPIHQNPSGATMVAEHRAKIVELCAGHGVKIIADEVYQLLTYEGSPPLPLASYLDSDTVLSVGSFSKILAPGLRLGWIHASKTLLSQISSLGIFASGGGVNQFTGCLVQSVLASGDQQRYLDSLVSVYRSRVQLMDRLLKHYLGHAVDYQMPQGGYFFWIRLQDGRDAGNLMEKAAEQMVGFRAGARFSTTGAFSDRLRLCFAHYDDQALEHGVARLSQVLARSPK